MKSASNFIMMKNLILTNRNKLCDIPFFMQIKTCIVLSIITQPFITSLAGDTARNVCCKTELKQHLH